MKIIFGLKIKFDLIASDDVDLYCWEATETAILRAHLSSFIPIQQLFFYFRF